MTTAFKPRTLIAAILIVILAAIPLQAQSVPEVELVGVIESMTLDSIVVNGLEVDISAAELNTAITVDEIVQVEGVLLLDGSILAREVKGVDEGVEVGEAELIGTLETFTAPNMFVNGQIIDVSGAEVNQGVTVGQMIKVHAYTVATNTWVAREVEAYVPDDSMPNDSSQPQPGEFEFSGTLEQIGQGFVVVSGQTISTEGAEIRNELMIGVRVRVHVSVQNGQMFARQIEFAFGRDDDNHNDNGNNNSNDNDDNGNINSNDNDSNANANANTNSNDNDDNGNSNDNSSVDTAITADQAIAIVLSIYPNTTITEIEMKSMFGGTLVWDIETSHDIEIVIDAQTGVVLSIEMDDNSGNNNTNSNDNTNFNSNDNDDDSNGNANFNSNDNDDDNNDDDDNDDNDDDDDDDNSGRGSRDDDDD